MSVARKDALKTLRGLFPQVEGHLEKIADNPEHSSLPKWESEVRTWLQQMKEMLRHVGKKTAAAWEERIKQYHEKLGS